MLRTSFASIWPRSIGVLESDKSNFAWYQHKVARRSEDKDTFIHPEVLPQPFIGDPRAPIWYLLLNPGFSYLDYYDHLGICPCCQRMLITENRADKSAVFDSGRDALGELKNRQNYLLAQLKLEGGLPFYMIDESFNTLKDTLWHSRDGGYKWWKTVLFGANKAEGFLLSDNGVMPDPVSVGQKIFVLECAPYHSKNFDRRVLWEENKYAKFWTRLISWAVETNRKFIVRSEQVASLLVQNKLQVNESNSLRFSSRQNCALTQRNLNGQDCVKDAIRNALLSSEETLNLKTDLPKPLGGCR